MFIVHQEYTQGIHPGIPALQVLTYSFLDVTKLQLGLRTSWFIYILNFSVDQSLCISGIRGEVLEQ